MKLIAFGLVAAFAAFVWFRGQTDELSATMLLGFATVGAVALSLLPFLSLECSVNDVLLLSDPWHHCQGMVVGYGLVAFGAVGLIKRAVARD